MRVGLLLLTLLMINTSFAGDRDVEVLQNNLNKYINLENMVLDTYEDLVDDAESYHLMTKTEVRWIRVQKMVAVPTKIATGLAAVIASSVFVPFGIAGLAFCPTCKPDTGTEIATLPIKSAKYFFDGFLDSNGKDGLTSRALAKLYLTHAIFMQKAIKEKM